MLSEHIERAMRKIEGWWRGELIDDRTCIGFFVPKPMKFLVNHRSNWRLLYSLARSYFFAKEIGNIRSRKTARARFPAIYSHFNDPWPHPAEGNADIEKVVGRWIKMIHSGAYFGEEMPKLPHFYGIRNLPLTMPAFLGADLEFLDDTITAKPFIDNWKETELVLQPPNIWYETSLKLTELATQKSKGEYLVDLPDFGDVFTSFYLMRGPAILQDLGFEPKLLKARDRFIELWIQVYETFWKITSQKFPGSSHWLIWAPGKSYACQCDAACIAVATSKKEVVPIILKRIVEDFIVPEMEKLGKYLDYIIWHLDGEEEIRFLSILLKLPQIKAIQWRPKYDGSPSSSPAHPKWFPLLRKIQKSGKNVWVAAENEKEVEGLIENLSPERLYISGGFTGKTEKEAREFLKKVEYWTRQNIKNRSF